MLSTRLFRVLPLLVFLVGCGDGNQPSNIGSVVEQRLSQGKADFESKDFRHMLSGSGINQNLQDQIVAIAEGAQEASTFVNPAWAREGIERSELALACLVSVARDEEEMSRIKAQLGSAVNDWEARQALFARMNELRGQLINTAFYREACQ